MDFIRARSRSPIGRGGPHIPYNHGKYRGQFPRKIMRTMSHRPHNKWRDDDFMMRFNSQSHLTQGRHIYSLPEDSSQINSHAPFYDDETSNPSPEWNEMMTFRTYIIMRTTEESDVREALESFEKYKESFVKEREPKVVWYLRNFPVIKQYYHRDHLSKDYEIASKRAMIEATRFMEMLNEDKLIGVNFVEQYSGFRSVVETKQTMRYLMSKLDNEAACEPYTSPYWLTPDPNLHSLCIRKLPAHISKWDLQEFLNQLVPSESIIDLSITEPPDFQLTLQGGTAKRTAWLQFVSAEACAAAEAKLERAMLKNFVIHPIARIPFPEKYSVTITISETCHPARILRDLYLSARLILRLDSQFNIIASPEGLALDEDLFESKCLKHPLLKEFQQVINGLSRSIEEQLDLQLLYLRTVHCVCYYSGKRFLTPRHLWEACGALYVRPRVDLGEVVESFSDFRSLEGNGWDKEYIEALDLSDQEALILASNGKLFSTGKNAPFEVTDISADRKVEKIINIKEEAMMVDSNGDKSPNDDRTKASSAQCNYIENDDTQNFENEWADSQRGRRSEWLQILDNRIARLLTEDIQGTCQMITDESPVVEAQWSEFCKEVIDEVAFEKWRCSLCSKMFRGVEFVKKHLKNKHVNFLEEILNDINNKEVIARYQSDPFRFLVAPPVIKHYLYRRGLPNYHQYEIPSAFNPNRKSQGHIDPEADSKFGRNKGMQYRDLDAPKPVPSTIANVREAISYDDI